MAEVTKLFGDGIVFLTTYAVIGLALGTVVRLGIWVADLWTAHRARQRRRAVRRAIAEADTMNLAEWARRVE